MLENGSLFGHYKIQKSLGKGGMGEVFLAHDTINSRVVALKVLSEEFAQSDEFRANLANEAELTAKIDSPYVVKVYEYAEIDGIPYLALEYILGKELRELLESFDQDIKIDLALKIAEGIGAAHAVGLIHRDLKPENILVDEDVQPKILDFGIAKPVDASEIDEFGDIEGTLYYLSPEQVSGELLTTGSDLFSFGVILYELFTKQRPFEGAYSASIIYSILHEDPIQPSKLNQELPIWIDALVSKLLAKKTEDRFENTEQLIEYINNCRKEGVPAVDLEWEKPKQKVTVVEIKNLANKTEFDYFCQGFTDDVITEISRRTDLVVTAEPSTAHQRNIKETFERLRSDFVIVGTLMLFREKIKLSLTIYGNNGEEIIWSEKFTDDADNLFEILAKATELASINLAKATDSEAFDVEEEFTADVTAYDYYLKGKSYYQTNKPDDLQFAIEMYTKAIEIDPTLALAHAGLADVHTFMYMAFYDRSEDRINNAHKEALRAIELNQKLPEAHRSLARYYMFTGEQGKAEESLMKAIDLNPKYAIAYRTLGWLKAGQDNLEDATYWTKKALKLAPVDLETHLLLGLISINQKKYTIAMATLERAIELGPDYGRAYYLLGQNYMKLGALDIALEKLSFAIKYKGEPNCYIDSGYIYLIKKEYSEARIQFSLSIESGYFPFVAEYYLGLTELLCKNQSAATIHFTEVLKQTNKYDIAKPENMHIAAYRALAYAGIGNHPEVLNHLENILNHDEIEADIKYLIARCYALINDKINSSLYVKEALESGSGPSEKEIQQDPHFSINS